VAVVVFTMEAALAQAVVVVVARAEPLIPQEAQEQ
jgi:hypothetical protein